MDSLKLGVVGLPEAEANLIATLFRLHRVERSFIWTLKTSPPFDALLVEGSLPDADFQQLCGTHTSIMRLSGPGEQKDGELKRPIRSDRLVSWLNSIEVGLLHGGHDAFASTASFSRLDVPLANVSAASPKLRPAEIAEKIAVETGDESTPFYKLKRWPPAALMAQEVGRIRIATILARKHISLQELASVSRVEESLCDVFLNTLIQNQLISIERRLPAKNAHASDEELQSVHEVGKKTIAGGLALIRSIRRRFGLI